MPARPFGLFDLLAPQFLLGFSFPDTVHQYLSKLGIDHVRAAYDESGVVYRGICSFTGTGSAEPDRRHVMPGGGVLRWEDVTLDFRLTIPRLGSQFIDKVVKALPGTELKDLLADLGEASKTGSDYPGIGFRLELMLSALTFHLGEQWLPAKVDADHRVVPIEKGDVKIVLPKVIFQYEQGETLDKAPSFKIKSWGDSGFDAPSDLAEGEVVTMDPPLAIHHGGRVAIGLEQAFVDFSEDSTPPEILSHFGVDEAFEGIYVKSLRLYYTDANKELGFNFAVNDVLISFDGWVSLEAELDVFGSKAPFRCKVLLVDGKDRQEQTGDNMPITQRGWIELDVFGGQSTYKISVKIEGEEVWDAKTRRAFISKEGGAPRNPGPVSVEVNVSDSATVPHTFKRSFKLKVTDSKLGPALNRGKSTLATGIKPAEFKIVTGAAVSGFDLVKVGEDGLDVLFQVKGKGPSVKVDGAAITLDSNQNFRVRAEEGKKLNLAVEYAVAPAGDTFKVFFSYSLPRKERWPGIIRNYVENKTELIESDIPFQTGYKDQVPLSGNGSELIQWIDNNLDPKEVTLLARASYEGDTTNQHEYNYLLSDRRLKVVREILKARPDIVVKEGKAVGDAGASGVREKLDRCVVVTGKAKIPPKQNITATLIRPKREEVPSSPEKPAEPPPYISKRPPVFRRLGLRLRLERNIPVLVEVSGQLDFETDLERKMRAASAEKGHEPPVGEKLELKATEAATKEPNPEDGVTDFKLNVTWNTSSRTLTETLTIGAAPGDKDGIFYMKNNVEDPLTVGNRFKNIFGATLILAPIITSTVSKLDRDSSAGDWVGFAAALAAPVVLGATGVVRTSRMIFYGGELKLRQNIPAGIETGKFTDFGITLDYGVEFKLKFEAGPFKINSKVPSKVRYKAIGFNVHTTDGGQFQPIFDTSKGYELELGDPGIFDLGPLSNILKVLSVRVAKMNPLTIEFDVGLKVDLGVVTVDSFKVKMPVDPLGFPTITPTGVKVDISSVIVGEGHLKLLDNGFEGSLDLSIVPVKVRVAASLAVQEITDGSRKATAVFASLVVTFPSPILLGASGLGIFGFAGLFAMHYKRLEEPRVPGEVVGPALKWLKKAKGEPTRLSTSEGPLWGPEFDRWSFGIGILLGTVEGGFLLNMVGMFVLELPGPRIIIMVKVQIIANMPSLGDKKLTVGMLGIIDLDFNLHTITIGIIIDLKIEKIIEISIPIEIFFSTKDSSNWHVFVGTIQAKVSAFILNIVRASGYFMIAGDKIEGFPGRDGKAMTLPGVAVAAGLEASIVFGNESAGLYLKVSAGADAGITFSPSFFLIGNMHLDGELRVFIFSIEAHGRADVEYPPAFVKVHVCISINLFLFSIDACVDFQIGDGSPVKPPAPPLIKGVFLRSHSAVITAGQGGERPIDATLGDAIVLERDEGLGLDKIPLDPTPGMFGHLVSGTITGVGHNLVADSSQKFTPGAYKGKSIKILDKFLKITDNTSTELTLSGPPPPGLNTYTIFSPVPIDCVPVIQFLCSPIASGAATFTSPLGESTGLTVGGWVAVGERQASYTLQGISLDPPPPPSPGPIPAVWIRAGQPRVDGGDHSADLALFSRIPFSAPRAVERSSDLDEQVIIAWKGVCTPVAPPTCIFWAFCDEPVGPSGLGWRLDGVARPDPPGTVRTEPPPTRLFVEEHMQSREEYLENVRRMDSGQPFNMPARIVGPDPLEPGEPVEQGPCERALQLPYRSDEGSPSVPVPPGDDKGINWIIFNTGAATHITFFVAIKDGARDDIFIRELDNRNIVAAEHRFPDLSPTPVTAVTNGLPPEWITAGSPWQARARGVAAFLASNKFSKMERFVFNLTPLSATTKIQIVSIPRFRFAEPVCVVGAVSVCPVAEVERAAHAIKIQESAKKTIVGAFDYAEPVALLAPNTTYTLRVRYASSTQNSDGTDGNNDPPRTQSFMFITDSEPPAQLSPWVLGVTPEDGEKFHFYEDPLQIIFNDLAIISLFDRYNKKLRVELYAADGVPNEADEIGALERVVTNLDLDPPFMASLRRLIDEGFLPCVGAISSKLHGSYKSPIPLRPAMGYTLDISAGPPFPKPEEKPLLPLFRRSFATSKFPTLRVMMDDLRAYKIQHRYLKATLAGLPTGSKPNLATDQQIQQALTAAGEQALPAAGKTGITVYWAKRNGETRYTPHAILIDASEPLWRTRMEPGLEAVPGQQEPSDPNYKRIVSLPAVALEVVEQGGTAIQDFVRSPAGTRTLAIINNAFTPNPEATIRLAVHRLPSKLFGITELTEVMTEIHLTAVAPWESPNA